MRPALGLIALFGALVVGSGVLSLAVLGVWDLKDGGWAALIALAWPLYLIVGYIRNRDYID